jgi:flagellar biosynthesis regulator FlaF
MNVGTVAGKIWKTLDKNGAMTANALVKELREKSNLVLMGIGWLLREDKLVISKNGNAIKYGLKKAE